MAFCPSCSAELPASSRWCPICHYNVFNLAIGRLASPGKRLGAFVLDSIVPVVVVVLVLMFAGSVGAILRHRPRNPFSEFDIDEGTVPDFGVETLVPLLVAIGLLLIYAVSVLVLFSKGTTPGKKSLGMRVVKEDGRRAGFWTMLMREIIGKTISTAYLLLGFLWIFLDREHQGWHDKLMRTYVVTE